MSQHVVIETTTTDDTFYTSYLCLKKTCFRISKKKFKNLKKLEKKSNFLNTLQCPIEMSHTIVESSFLFRAFCESQRFIQMINYCLKVHNRTLSTNHTEKRTPSKSFKTLFNCKREHLNDFNCIPNSQFKKQRKNFVVFLPYSGSLLYNIGGGIEV